jgi:hypothetical protein
VRTKTMRENKLYPGRPNYTGPNKGWFAFVHHGSLCEHTGQFPGGIEERVEYINRAKPPDEIPTRLRHLIYLGQTLNEALTKAAGGTYYATGSCRGVVEMHQHKALRGRVLRYVKRHIKPFRWNGRWLTHANGGSFTG